MKKERLLHGCRERTLLLRTENTEEWEGKEQHKKWTCQEENRAWDGARTTADDRRGKRRRRRTVRSTRKKDVFDIIFIHNQPIFFSYPFLNFFFLLLLLEEWKTLFVCVIPFFSFLFSFESGLLFPRVCVRETTRIGSQRVIGICLPPCDGFDSQHSGKADQFRND